MKLPKDVLDYFRRCGSRGGKTISPAGPLDAKTWGALAAVHLGN